MNQDIKKRLSGLENIIQSLHENLDILFFIAVETHAEKFNYFNNKFLLWLWRMIISQQVISFYLVIHKEEKHSLQKIINLLVAAKIQIDYGRINNLISNLNEEYSKNKFGTIRSKYLAHKDIGVEEVKTNLRPIIDFTKSIIEAYKVVLNELNLEQPEFSDEVRSSIKEIFSHIHEYENLLTYINFEMKRGKTVLPISEIINQSKL